jgi:hypothetical protein
MSKNAIEYYIYLFPQLSLPVEAGMSSDKRYTDIVKRGIMPQNPDNPFNGTDEDEAFNMKTPAGVIKGIYLADRSDFERFICVFTGRCEPVYIPKTTGAMTYFNVINWRKIMLHMFEYLTEGGLDWNTEFDKFTSSQSSYTDSFMAISKGYYSDVSPEKTGYSEDEWINKSRVIRTYHEASHFVSRELYPENKNTIRDEIIADCIGIIAATGRYDPVLAGRLLGIEKGIYEKGRRLENYISPADAITDVLKEVDKLISSCDEYCHNLKEKEPFAVLESLEKNRICMK